MRGQVIYDVVEFVGRALCAASNHVAGQVAPFVPRLRHAGHVFGAVARTADLFHGVAPGAGGQPLLGLAGEKNKNER